MCAPMSLEYDMLTPLSLMRLQPQKPGQKRQKEDWENIWYYGFFGVMALTAVGQYFRPDTR